VKARLLHEADGLRTWVLVYAHGDEVIAELERFTHEQGVSAAGFTAIGAFERATLAYFRWETKEYEQLPVDEQVEVLTLAGDVAVDVDGAPAVHAHVVVGRSDGTTRGGHLLEATVRPTLELILTEAPAHLRKRKDAETGLALIDPGL
jgi:predicted DNA-binding protein with PD1-like motif